jgi:hypothetical protein
MIIDLDWVLAQGGQRKIEILKKKSMIIWEGPLMREVLID